MLAAASGLHELQGPVTEAACLSSCLYLQWSLTVVWLTPVLQDPRQRGGARPAHEHDFGGHAATGALGGEVASAHLSVGFSASDSAESWSCGGGISHTAAYLLCCAALLAGVRQQPRGGDVGAQH